MMRVRPDPSGWSATLLLAVLLLGGAFPERTRAAETLPEAFEVTQRMIERAHAVARTETSPPYAYQKRVLQEHLDAHGQALKSEEKIYQGTLVAGYPFNRLLKIRGRDLSREELAREEAREERFRQRFISADPKRMAARKEGWVTPQLLERYQFVVKERVLLNNRSTLVLTFQPKEGQKPEKGVQDKLLNHMAGTVWIDEEEAETAKLEVRLVQSISLGWFGILGSLTRCELSLERTRMTEGVWINASQILQLQYRKLGSTARIRITEESSDFKKMEKLR